MIIKFKNVAAEFPAYIWLDVLQLWALLRETWPRVLVMYSTDDGVHLS